jgi:energy-coupling factor transporter ATP-binding protein EcfA2
VWRLALDCLGVAVEVSSPDPELARAVTLLTATYAPAAGPPQLRYELCASPPVIVAQGQAVAQPELAEDVPAVWELDLYRRLLERTQGCALHAAALSPAPGEALVFAGLSGAGKSTLTRALLAQGWAYATEEMVAVGPDGTCHSLTRPLHLEEGDAPIALPGGRLERYPMRRPLGLPPVHLCAPPAERLIHGALRASAIVVLSHGGVRPASCERLSAGAAAVALWPHVLNPTAEALQVAAQFLRVVPVFALHSHSPQEALDHVRFVRQALGALPVTPAPVLPVG